MRDLVQCPCLVREGAPFDAHSRSLPPSESLAAEARALKRLRALYADESTRIRREGLVLKAVLQDELQAREDAALFPLPGAGGGNVDVASSSSSGSSLQTPSIRAVGKGSAPPSSSAAPRRAGGAGRSGAARRGGGQGVGGTESGIESGYDGAGEEMGVAAAVAMTDVDDDALLQELQAEAERRENAREEGR